MRKEQGRASATVRKLQEQNRDCESHCRAYVVGGTEVHLFPRASRHSPSATTVYEREAVRRTDCKRRAWTQEAKTTARAADSSCEGREETLHSRNTKCQMLSAGHRRPVVGRRCSGTHRRASTAACTWGSQSEEATGNRKGLTCAHFQRDNCVSRRAAALLLTQDEQ